MFQWKWKSSEERRVHMGFVGHKSDDPTSEQVMWKPAPKVLEVVDFNVDRLVTQVRDLESGDKMWVRDGKLRDDYDEAEVQ